MATAPENAVVVAEQSRLALIRTELEKRERDLLAVLPEGMDAARFTRVSLLAITKNPDLLECSAGSIVSAIVEAAEVGLEPTGGVGGAWLVPFREGGQRRAQLIYDYRGIQYLIRAGGGGEVETTLVYEGEPFRVYKGTNPRIDHEPRYETIDPTKITHVYAVAMDSGKFEVMSKEDIDRIRARSRASNNGPWVTDYGAMARKSVLKRIGNWLPLKPFARAAIEADTEREFGPGPAPSQPSVTRAAQIRERISTRRKASAPRNAPGADGDTDPQSGAARAGSAAQQPDAAGEAPVCGAAHPEEEGQTCAKRGDHDAHANADGSLIWPNPKASEASGQ